MGDMLQASPLFSGLKTDYPDCETTVLIDKSLATICKGIPGIDQLVEIDLSYVMRLAVNGGELLVEGYRYVDRLVKDLSSRKFDICMNISSSSYSALLIKMLNIEDCRGWVSDEEGNRLIGSPWSRLFAANVYYSNRDYNSINLVDFLRCGLDVRSQPERLHYQVPSEARESVRVKLQSLGLKGAGPLICIQAGASQEKRQWAPARFAHLTRLLTQELDARIVFTGTASEAPIIDTIMKLYPSANIGSVAGKTSIPELGALLEQSALLITGDTGTMHMSVAVGVPVVAIFLASALCYETGPYSRGNLIVQALLGCCPCNPNYPCGQPDCHSQVRPELIAFLSRKRLEMKESELANLKIPPEMAEPGETAVFYSDFDAERFCELKLLNPGGQRLGVPTEHYYSARSAYRKLWKEEFGFAHRQGVSSLGEFRDALSEGPEGVAIKSAQDLSDLAERGIQLLDRLEELVRDDKSPPFLLGDVNKDLTKTDQLIEDLGLAFPLLGPVTRIFIIEKQNIRGNDVLYLASQMRELYQTLHRRVELLLKYYTMEMYAARNC